MKTSLLSAFVLAVCAGCAALVADDSAGGSSQLGSVRAKAKDVLGALPDKMPGGENDSAQLVALGRKLYFDKLLSVNQTISCNSCHVVDNNKGGVDGEATSPGAFGKRGGRNSPTVLNAGFHFAQFWDGRAPHLQAQAKGPILNPIEMAMPNEAEVLNRLRASPDYTALFDQAFPNAGDKITYDNLAHAIAAFERTLVTHDRFDDFLKGDDKALNSRELRGLDLFLNTGCTTCHQGPLLGATTYQKVGLIHPYENKEDLGREAVTKDEDDRYKFKVPTLRNIAITGPYFHDGTRKTLKEVVPQMAHMQLDKQLTTDEVDSVVAFLNTLTDKPRRTRK
jgi:cytochrome c peroxidase